MGTKKFPNIRLQLVFFEVEGNTEKVESELVQSVLFTQMIKSLNSLAAFKCDPKMPLIL